MQNGGWKFCLQPLKQYPNGLSHGMLSSQCPHFLEQFAPKYPSLHSFKRNINKENESNLYFDMSTKGMMIVQNGYKRSQSNKI